MSELRYSELARLGLCAACVHHRLVVSGRGSRFHLCELSRERPAFPRYPVLPVLECEGFAPHPESGAT